MKKILLVDDQPDVRELLSVTLEVGPYDILTAESGTQALEIVRDALPDLILLDVMMPGGPDGLEVCRQLKADARTQDVIVIMLTAKGEKQNVEEGYRAGADGYFVKPFSPIELIEKVESVLGC